MVEATPITDVPSPSGWHCRDRVLSADQIRALWTPLPRWRRLFGGA